MGRIKDAIIALLFASELSRIRTQWLALQVEINTAMETLNTLAARLAKRESRARRAVEEDPPQAPAFPGMDPGSHKMVALSRAARAALPDRFPQIGPIPQGDNGSEGQPGGES